MSTVNVRISRKQWDEIVALSVVHRRSHTKELATVVERGLRGFASEEVTRLSRERVERMMSAGRE